MKALKSIDFVTVLITVGTTILALYLYHQFIAKRFVTDEAV